MDDSTGRVTEDFPEQAMWSLSSHVRFWLVAGIVVWLDLWSKTWAFANLGPGEIREILRGVIEFRRSLNTGAVFGSFAGYTSVFIVASLFALGFVLYMFARSARMQAALHIALALILAGAVGNLYDRTFLKADVVIRRTDSGVEETTVGKIISDPDAAVLRIGDWPGGENARRFARSAVTVRSQGVVRDFIKFVPRFPASVPKFAGRDIWPWVFNVADAALVCGVCLLLISSWVDRDPHRRAE
jgi:lipoprotein signal peptidase